jgi:predicted dehydrogenase
MDYKLGVIGLGHWFDRLNVGIQKVGGLTLVKAVGTRSFEDKASLLEGFGITKEDYYLADSDGTIPETFFKDIEVAHISDPNKFHAAQTKQALEHGKYSITEKSLATTQAEFEDISSFIKKNNFEDKFYLHLHYIHKQPTLALKAMLPDLVGKYGKIKNIDATFFEKETEEDARRKWLFAPENGGIFMDWIHPFEIIYHSTDSTFGNITDLSLYAVKPSYDAINPSGVAATVALDGKYSSNASANIRIAKGVKSSEDKKSIKITFESGTYAILNYVGSGTEFESNERGTIEIRDQNHNIIETKRLTGPNSSEIFVEEILNLSKGRPMGLTLSQIAEIFKPQWEYQSIMKSKELIKNDSQVNSFIKKGLDSVM